jgi:hypothetical protein
MQSRYGYKCRIDSAHQDVRREGYADDYRSFAEFWTIWSNNRNASTALRGEIPTPGKNLGQRMIVVSAQCATRAKSKVGYVLSDSLWQRKEVGVKNGYGLMVCIPQSFNRSALPRFSFLFLSTAGCPRFIALTGWMRRPGEFAKTLKIQC